MEKVLAAIEFGSRKLKMVIGYEIDGQVYVFYAITKDYSGCIENGKIIDPKPILDLTKDIKFFTDDGAKLRLNISEVLLSLPPFGLQVLFADPVTTVTSEEGKIASLDIKNLYNLIRNGTSQIDNELITIVPTQYFMDHGRTCSATPLGEISSTLKLNAFVHTIPRNVVEEYSSLLTANGVSVKKSIASPFGAASLIGSYSEFPEDYILLDIGSDLSTISLVGKKNVYCSVTFKWGGFDITKAIMNSFEINEIEAEYIKITYGLDNRIFNFNAPVFESVKEDGSPNKHYQEELNDVIKGELLNFLNKYKINLDILLNKDSYDQSFHRFPLLITGGCSLLVGLKEFLEPKIDNEKVMIVVPKCLGARNPTFTNCLGLILASNKCPNVYDENHPNIGKLTRDTK